MKNIIVIGSLNKDLVNFCSRYPNIGETVKGLEYKEFNGGKGGNQAVALSNLGSKVYMIAKVGEDNFGTSLIKSLEEKGINTDFVNKTNQTTTGTATILVDNATKDNAIVVNAGANNLLTEEDIKNASTLFKKSSFLVSQFEVPFKTVLYSFKLAQKNNVKTVLNPSPMLEEVDQILPYCDYLIINQTELEEITKQSINNNEELKEKTINLYNKYNFTTIIVTLGSNGVIAYNNDEFIQIPAHKVNAKDTTGAGDTFAGGVISQINNGHSLEQALKFSTGASALAVSTEGAQNSIPTVDQVEAFLTNL